MEEPNILNVSDISQQEAGRIIIRFIIYSTGTKGTGHASLLVSTIPKKSDYQRDRVEKYAEYFKQNEILPIPELVKAVEPKHLSFVVTDLRTRRLAGIKKRNHLKNF